jgi:hypothetical protein
MAYYINNSSRRFPQPPQEEMEKSWEEGLGKPTGAVCNVCGQKSYDGKLVNGLCRKCRAEPEITMEEAMSELDESIKESEERDLNAESSGGYQNDY